MLLIGAVEFSTEAVGIIGAVVGTLWTALVMMWRQDLNARDRVIADLREQRDQLQRIIIEHGLRSALPPHLSPPVSPESGSGLHRPLSPSDPNQ